MVTAAELVEILNGVKFTVPRAKDVPEFYGRSDPKPFSDVVEQLNVIINLYKITGDEDKARLLASTMRGLALTTFNEVLDDWEAAHETYDELIDRLAREFKQPGTNLMFRRLFNNRKKKPQEELETFAKDLTRLAKQAYTSDDGFTEEQREKLLTDTFISGLPDDMREQLMRKGIETMKEALAAAHIESNIQSSRKEPPSTEDKTSKIVAALEMLAVMQQPPPTVNNGFQYPAFGVPIQANNYPAQVIGYQQPQPFGYAGYQPIMPVPQWPQMNYVGHFNSMPAINGFNNFNGYNNDYNNDDDENDNYENDDNEYDDDDGDFQDTNDYDDYGQDY